MACMVLCIVLICILGHAIAELPRFHHPMKADNGTLNFVVIGDWGRRGEYNQSHVAYQMGKYGEKVDLDFVISTGDNFYDNGLTGEKDPNFVDSFTNIYTAKTLQKQWYSVLGNHDYRGNVEAQFSPYLKQVDSRWICLRSFVVNTEIAEIFFVDTTPFVRDYFVVPNEHTDDWKGVTPPRRYVSKLLTDLELALKNSTAKWKIVVGHQFENKVDFYMNGHDHCLEQISDDKSKIQFLTSGAGSKAWGGDVKDLNGKGLKFLYDGQGFMSVKLTNTMAEIAFYDVVGQVLHKWTSPSVVHSNL